jgi:hypothetical protein
MIEFVVTEELGCLWVQSMVREIRLPTIVDLWSNFPFFNLYLPCGQAHQVTLLYNTAACLLIRRCLATGSSFLTSSAWNQNTPVGGFTTACVYVHSVVAELNWLIVKALLPNL